MTPLEAILLRRAEEQADSVRELSTAESRRRHDQQATGKCKCGRPIYRDGVRCSLCTQKLRDHSADVLEAKRRKHAEAAHVRSALVELAKSRRYGVTSRDVSDALGLSTSAAQVALSRAYRMGWLARMEPGRYVAGEKARRGGGHEAASPDASAAADET